MAPFLPRPSRPTFPPRLRLRHDLEFAAVLKARMRASRGPLSISTLPNTLANPRLGLSIPKRIGNAPTRNRCKRLVREAFRLIQHDLPRHRTGSYDLLVSVRMADGLTLDTCKTLLLELARQAHEGWERRTPNPDAPS